MTTLSTVSASRYTRPQTLAPVAPAPVASRTASTSTQSFSFLADSADFSSTTRPARPVIDPYAQKPGYDPYAQKPGYDPYAS